MARLAKLAVVLVSVCVGGGLAELSLRAVGYRYSPVQIGATRANDYRATHAFQDRNLVYDPHLIWRPLSGQFSPFNPQGFRGAPLDTVKPPGERRVVAIGDSNTFGWAVDDGVNWPTQLEALLRKDRSGVRVVNAGVWGYTLYQGRRRFEEMLAFEPDVVLISFGGNDAHQVTVPDVEYVRRHERIALVTRLSARSRLAQLVVAAWDRMSAAGEGPLGPRVPLEDYRVYLREIITAARTRGVRLVLLTRPFVGTSTDPTVWKTYAPDYNAATLEVGRTEGVPVVDVYGAFKARDALFDDESHFGVEGHRMAAELLAPVVAGLLNVKTPGSP